MANTYTQLYAHIIFSVKHRDRCISAEHREEVQKYITAIVASLNQKMMALYCMPDHIHILVGFKPEISLSEIVNKVKSNFSKFINKKGWMQAKFEWQVGFSGFTYSQSHIPVVIEYILNQPEHHRTKTFKEEYQRFLDKYEVEYDPKYLFDLE